MKQLIMALIFIVTVVVSVKLRSDAAGWNILLFGIPDVISFIIHIIVHIKSVLNIPKKPPSYISLMLFSNLFFFLWLVFQADADDRRWYLPILFWTSTVPSDQLLNFAGYVWLLSLLALIVSWVLLMDKDKWLYPLKLRKQPPNP